MLDDRECRSMGRGCRLGGHQERWGDMGDGQLKGIEGVGSGGNWKRSKFGGVGIVVVVV